MGSHQHTFVEKKESMQQILFHTTGKQLFLQCSEIVKNAHVCLTNKNGLEVLNMKMTNTNFIKIDLDLPNGEYTIKMKEDQKTWKRNFYL